MDNSSNYVASCGIYARADTSVFTGLPADAQRSRQRKGLPRAEERVGRKRSLDPESVSDRPEKPEPDEG